MNAASERFNVHQFLVGGDHICVHEGLDGAHAVKQANELLHTLGAQIGSTCRIVITDENDCVRWEWRFDRGVIFPPGPVLPHKD